VPDTNGMLDRKEKKTREEGEREIPCDQKNKKLELVVTKNFSLQFVKISIIRCQSQKLG
jgi:hypothetical protein